MSDVEQELLPLLKAARDIVSLHLNQCHNEVSQPPPAGGRAVNIMVMLMRRTKASETLEELDALIASIERSPEEYWETLRRKLNEHIRTRRRR